MLKYILLSIILVFSSLNAKEYYINSLNGSDTTSSFDGLSPNKSFKSIHKALNLVEQGDIIIIEGKSKDKALIYKENIIVGENMPFFIIRGKDNPTIKSNDDNRNIGVLALNKDIRIEGLTFDGFVDGKMSDINKNGGAAIVIKDGFRDAVINNCKFINCNYGIIANENQSIRINGNEFTKITKLSNKPLDGGIAIQILSHDKYIQDNQIGTEAKNTFSEIDNYGILIGNNDKLVLADYSKIENNTFSNSKGCGIALFNVEGIVSVTKNIFDKCETSLEIKGLSVDAIISDNVFKGATGNYEVLSDENYPGDLLYSIWKGNNNTFTNKLHGVSENNEQSIKSIDGKRFITTNEKLLKSSIKGDMKILD
ncbi:MAG TPA: right-handed parallel beta-helix repeat-containing protein [Candidatus Kapabacteria bacterium]|nr:right-handed parallel beta-helix repeat-containing protein [Candidatus Kapabacteria bacterium]